MKQQYFRLALVAISMVQGLASYGTTITVNNNFNLPSNPGQYTTLQSGINAAAAGDTILVAGSPNSYLGATVSKKLYIFGEGYNPGNQTGYATVLGSIQFDRVSGSSSSGSTLQGVSVQIAQIGTQNGGTISKISIRRCKLETLAIADTTEDVVVAQCIFSGVGGGVNINLSIHHSNLRIVNNIFNEGETIFTTNGVPSNITPIYIEHNLFYGSGILNPSGSIGNLIRNAVFANNIFYSIQPVITGGSAQNILNNSFNNNISYSPSGTVTTMPAQYNIGAGNLNNSNPQMVQLYAAPIASSALLANFNLRLQPGSPAINAATNGSNIGPTGGAFPIYSSTTDMLTGEPRLPVVKYVNVIGNSAVAPGGTLNIEVKAKKAN